MKSISEELRQMANVLKGMAIVLHDNSDYSTSNKIKEYSMKLEEIAGNIDFKPLIPNNDYSKDVELMKGVIPCSSKLAKIAKELDEHENCFNLKFGDIEMCCRAVNMKYTADGPGISPKIKFEMEEI